MIKLTNYRLSIVSLLSTTVLTGCVVWKSDYEALQAQNQQRSGGRQPKVWLHGCEVVHRFPDAALLSL